MKKAFLRHLIFREHGADWKKQNHAGNVKRPSGFVLILSVFLLTCFVDLSHASRLRNLTYATSPSSQFLSTSVDPATVIAVSTNRTCDSCTIRHSYRAKQILPALFNLSDLALLFLLCLPQAELFTSSRVVSSLQPRAPPRFIPNY
jgi:hypothetical protein